MGQVGEPESLFLCLRIVATDHKFACYELHDGSSPCLGIYKGYERRERLVYEGFVGNSKENFRQEESFVIWSNFKAQSDLFAD